MATSLFSDVFPSFKGERIFLLILTWDLRKNFGRSSHTETIPRNDIVAGTYLCYIPASYIFNWNYFLAFYGYFFDLLDAVDFIPTTHPTSQRHCRGSSGGSDFSTFSGDFSFCTHTIIGRLGFTCDAIHFYFSGFLPF